MTTPNLLNLTSITGTNAELTPANTTANVLVANAIGSNQLLKVNQVVAANVNGAATVNATLAINSLASGAGTSYPIASAVPVPISASLIIVDKTTTVYLNENQSLVVQSGTASGLSYTASYEVMQ
jgi:hypothetical protein